MKKAALILTILIIFLIGGFFGIRRKDLRDQRDLLSGLDIFTVERGTLPFTIDAKGRVTSNQNAILYWEIPGKIGQVNVTPGMQVAVGDVLATLETKSLPSYVILAQSDLVRAQKALDNLYQSQMQQARALKAMVDAQEALEDARNPEVAQAQALVEMVNAQAAVEKAQQQYDILTATVSQFAIDQAYANLLLAKNKLDQTRDTVQKIEQQIMFGAAGIPDFLPETYKTQARTEIRKALRQALKGLQIQLTQDQLAYENSLARYNSLLKPPDAMDVMVAESALATAQAQLEDARIKWERIKDGPDAAEVAVLEAVLVDAQREWERVKDGPDLDEIAVLEAQVAASQAILNQIKITAPFDGVITLVQVQAGDTVNPGTLAFRIDDVSHHFVELAISEIDINQIKAGQDVFLTFEAVMAKAYHGKVVEVALVGTELLGAVNFNVIVELLNADDDIRIGMTSEVEIVTRQKENVLSIPNRSIRVLDGEKVVYVLGNGLPKKASLSWLRNFFSPVIDILAMDTGVHPVRIDLGETASKLSEVTAGNLEPGSQVVLDPPSELTQIPQTRSSRIIFRHP